MTVNWEQPAQETGTENSELQTFQQVVEQLKIEEQTRGREVHLTEVDSQDLTLTDARMFEQVMDLVKDLQVVKELTDQDKDRARSLVAEYRKYRQTVLDNDSRHQFAAYLGNKLQSVPAVYLS